MTDWKERAERAEAELARLRAQEPEYWQWRRKRDPWEIGKTFNSQVYATTADSEVRCLYAAPPAQPADRIEMSPEFTDSARSALLWVLWHHQGGSSKVGQPIRFALGIGQHEHLSDYQIREAKRWDLLPQTVAAQPADPIAARSRYETAYAGHQLPHTQTTTSEPVQLTEVEIFKAYTTATGEVLPNIGSSRAELVAITRIIEQAHGITGAKK